MLSFSKILQIILVIVLIIVIVFCNRELFEQNCFTKKILDYFMPEKNINVPVSTTENIDSEELFNTEYAVTEDMDRALSDALKSAF